MKQSEVTGAISLFTSKGHLLAKRRYVGRWQRRQILIEWKASYRERFKNYYYQILPDLTTVRQKALA